jgi:polygalacturonase
MRKENAWAYRQVAIVAMSAALACAASTRAAAAAPLDVTQCGATGDGKTNDTAAFEKALASGAKDVYIPPGTYNLGPGVVTVPGDTYLHGAGTATVI